MGAAPKISHRPDVFDYHDYRTFLSDMFAYLKDHQPGFSVRHLARQVGVSSGYFNMVIKEGSPLSPRVLAQLGSPLGLNQEELNYWAHLAALIDAKTLEAQRLAFRKLSRFGLYKSRHHEAILAHQYFSNWYFVAIRELANRSDFKPDAKWINEHLVKRVPLSEIRSALDFLMRYELIVSNNEGGYSASASRLECEGAIYRMALTEFYKQTYQMCIESIYEIPREERHLASHTVALSADGFAKLQKIIQNSIDQLQELSVTEDQKDPDKRVYHVSLAAIPLSTAGGRQR